MLLNIFLLAVGFIFLIKGADFLVDGSSSLARRFGVRSFIIGLTVVAFGTSAPELIVNLMSVITGVDGLALGNIFGSNLANILLILGVAAILSPVVMHRGMVWRELPFLLLASLMVLILGLDVFLDGVDINVLSRIDGLVLLGFFLVFLYYTYISGKEKINESNQIEVFGLTKTFFLISFGLLGLGFGGEFIVDSAVFFAQTFGISDHVIGATIIAVGTSLPELVTTVVAVGKGHSQLAIGNVVGSNLFNILFVLGITSTVSPLVYSQSALIDAGLVVIITFILFLSLFVGKKHHFEKWQGIIFILLYIAYIGFSLYHG